MAGYCTSVSLYFHKLQASKNTPQECNNQPHCLLNHSNNRYYYILLFYSTILLVSSYEINLNIPHLNMIFTSNIPRLNMTFTS